MLPNFTRAAALVFLITAAFPCSPASSLDEKPNVVVREGWDWSLPQSTKPVPYSGFITWGGKRFDSAITVSGIHITWADLNPAPGIYNWKPLFGRIAKDRAAGMRVGLHLKGVERKGIPDWIIETYDPPVIDVPPLQENQPWRIQVVPPWHPFVEKAFLEFLAEFRKTGIPQMDDVVYGYIHGISPSRGEEIILRPVDVEILERQAGLTPEQFASWMRRRIDGMLAAFEGVEHKLAWMSGGPIGPTAEYRKATQGLWEYAFERGTGIRGGAIDFMHALFSQPAWGSSINEQGYCIIDEENLTISQLRFRGDENEEYGPQWEWRFGPAEGHTYRHRISSLRALQMRQNFQLVSAATLQQNPALNQYVLLTQGRHRGNSPDAWAYLRESRLREFKQTPVRNMERWLVQRDVPGSKSVPTEKILRHPLRFDLPGASFDLDARRTDRANGQNSLAFQIDSEFWKTPGPALVKVTFINRQPCRWHLVTAEPNGQLVKSAPVESDSSGKKATATFRVKEFAASRSFPGKMDFHLVNEGPGDLVVQMVRVIHADFHE